MENNDATNLAVLAKSNVIPSTRKVVTESWDSTLTISDLSVSDLYNPGKVNLNRVSGGFNSVVQVSAKSCLRSYSEQTGQISIINRKRGEVFSSFLESINGNLVDPFWPGFSVKSELTYGIGYTLEPVELNFIDPNMVAIRLRGEITLLEEKKKTGPIRNPQQPPWNQEPEFQFNHDISKLDGEQHTEAPVILKNRNGGSGIVQNQYLQSVTGAQVAGIEAERYIPEVPLRAVKTFGSIEVMLKANYFSVQHKPQKSVDILLDLSQAEVGSIVEEGDAKLLYDTFLVSMEPLLAAYLVPHPEIPLTPTISLVGRNNANIAVSEFPQFETRVFHVSSGSKQAICAAFDVVTGCQGIIEDVEHFIGGSDYGVIHDEYVVERIIRHKWAQGGFDRSLAIARKISVRVKRDGRERDEDAMVYGRLLLDSLDVVALEPHADLRGDMLLLSGQARGVAERVVLLTDGTALTPENTELGPPEAASWAVNTIASITTPWEPDSELRDFQQKAHADGIRHLSRPFLRFPLSYYYMPSVKYVRTEAIQKRMFFLGKLPYMFS